MKIDGTAMKMSDDTLCLLRISAFCDELFPNDIGLNCTN